MLNVLGKTVVGHCGLRFDRWLGMVDDRLIRQPNRTGTAVVWQRQAYDVRLLNRCLLPGVRI